MKEQERKMIEALDVYLHARIEFADSRQKLKMSALSPDTITALGRLVANSYGCHMVATKAGTISFCDSPSEPRLTRRDDARKFWIRTVIGQPN